ncbi:MAG: rhodanese-like domain-containing protein [Deltaproteobacteria bacterium]|nr:rhodanese-like domain-containing protein [Deltaproteobacteria bacterium]MDH3383064.1 rhodanese-like domain-containing protein [Deltaproteobacteria bacterium]
MKKISIRFFLAFLSLLFLLPASSYAGQTGYKGFPRGDALITVQELKRLLDDGDPSLVIIAAERSVGYRTAHIPGAYHLDRPDYAAPPDTQNGVTGNILGAAGFTELARRMGINRDSTVVVYDSKLDATRLWWAFTYYGKGDVRVLDGGFKAWEDAGYPVEVLAPDASAQPGNFVAKVALPHLRVDTADIVALRNNPAAQLWDNRSIEEFTGEKQKKGAYRAGRIPGGRHAEWTLFKKRENRAEWLTAAEIQPLLRKLGFDPEKEQYFYCQSGVRTTQVLFALYLSGWELEKLHNYDSSWIGWSKDDSLPLEAGVPSIGAQEQARR